MSDDINEAIVKAKQQLERMIDLNPEIMLLISWDGRVNRANKRLLKFLGMDEKDYNGVLGRPIDSLFKTGNPAFFKELLQKRTDDVRETLVDFGGKRKHMLRFTVVGGGIAEDLAAVVISDVTADKEKSFILEKEHKKAAVQMLMGALMHTINQPLTVITAKAHLMHLSLEQGTMEAAEMNRNLKDIMRMTLEIADLLERVQTPKDFVTQPYLPNVDILDLDKSAPDSIAKKPMSAIALDVLLATLEKREPGFASHSLRVGDYVALMAERLGLGERERNTFKFCAVFHDIGKIGVPDSILQKPGRLTGAEMSIMKTHSETGYNLVRSFSTMKTESEIIYAHHERYDGTGYPRGLAGQHIPLGARLIAIADSFDVLRIGRPYQDGVAIEKVVEEIRAGLGTQFDPELGKVFDACYGEMDGMFQSKGPSGRS